MVCNFTVTFFIDIISNDEEKIETGEKRVGEGDILMWIFVDIVLHMGVKAASANYLTTTYLSIYWVGSRDDATPSI